MKTGTFSQRIALGTQGQRELENELRSRGFIITPTGQEKFIPDAIHDDLRHIHDDPTVRAIRFQPDFMAYRDNFPVSYWEAKVNTRDDTPNFAIEKSCYEELMARHANHQRCVIAFRKVDGLWVANWVEEIKVVKDMTSRRQQANGSHTPFLLVAKESFPLLDLFIATHTTGMVRTI